MKPVKGNSRSTISTQGNHQTKILVLNNHSLRTNPKQIFCIRYWSWLQKNITRTSPKKPIHELRCRDKLTIPETYQRQTTLRQGLSPVSSMQMHGICSALGQAVNSQNSLWCIDVSSWATPTALNCLGFNLYHTATNIQSHDQLFTLTPLGFHSWNVSVYVTSQMYILFENVNCFWKTRRYLTCHCFYYLNAQ